jgi:hypothetical protein
VRVIKGAPIAAQTVFPTLWAGDTTTNTSAQTASVLDRTLIHPYLPMRGLSMASSDEEKIRQSIKTKKGILKEGADMSKGRRDGLEQDNMRSRAKLRRNRSER